MCWCWPGIFTREIMHGSRAYRQLGGRFIVPDSGAGSGGGGSLAYTGVAVWYMAPDVFF